MTVPPSDDMTVTVSVDMIARFRKALAEIGPGMRSDHWNAFIDIEIALAEAQPKRA